MLIGFYTIRVDYTITPKYTDHMDVDIISQ